MLSAALTHAELLYLAGFFDGEGSVGIYRRGKTKQSATLSMTVVQNWSPESERLLRRWQETLGGYVTFARSANGRLKMQWQASSWVAASILEVLEPHLVLKRPQVELALRYQRSLPAEPRRDTGTGRMLAFGITPEMNAIIETLKQMKREVLSEPAWAASVGSKA